MKRRVKGHYGRAILGEEEDMRLVIRVASYGHCPHEPKPERLGLRSDPGHVGPEEACANPGHAEYQRDMRTDPACTRIMQVSDAGNAFVIGLAQDRRGDAVELRPAGSFYILHCSAKASPRSSSATPTIRFVMTSPSFTTSRT